MRLRLSFFSVVALVLVTTSCGYRKNQSGMHWFLDMHDTLAVEAQEEDPTTLDDGTERTRGAGLAEVLAGPGSGIRVPPQGSVPRNFQPYLIADIEEAGRSLRNPLPMTKAVLARGQDQYQVYCALCHGNRGGNLATGRGDGSVTPRFPAELVPGLVGAKSNAVNWSDGKIYHMITRGRNAMLPYEAQIAPADRWAIVHYIRLLQKAAEKK